MVVRCVELCPLALNRPDLHFEGADNGPVVISWIGRVHDLYSGASPISLIEHCATYRHDRRLLSLLGFVHNWPTSRWSAAKKENRFSLKGNGIMSFLGQQFYRSTLYTRPNTNTKIRTTQYTHINTYDQIHTHKYIRPNTHTKIQTTQYTHINTYDPMHTHKDIRANTHA